MNSILPLAKCRFCQAQMTYLKSYTDPPRGTSEPYHEFHCEPCRSTQFVDSINNKPMHFWFYVGNYHLYFMVNTTNKIKFQLVQDKPEYHILLELDFLPLHLTPLNTTEERIKAMVLFS